MAAKTPPQPNGESRTRRLSLKDGRMEVRVSPATKELCKRAAAIKGRSLTDFVTNSVVEAAERVIREDEILELTRRDRIAFVEALLNPPQPNRILREAVERHRQIFGE